MEKLLLGLQIIFSLTLITLIMAQPSQGSENSSRIMSNTAPTKRGLEKLSFQATFATLALFLLISLAQIII